MKVIGTLIVIGLAISCAYISFSGRAGAYITFGSYLEQDFPFIIDLYYPIWNFFDNIVDKLNSFFCG